MTLKKTTLITTGVLLSTLIVSGCNSTGKTRAEQEQEKNILTGVAAIGGVFMANAMGIDNNLGKVAVGAITGFTARKIYEDVNKDVASDPDTEVTPVSINGQEYIKVEVKDINFRSGSAQLDPSQLTRIQPVLNALTNYPNTRVHIEGHTDSDGSSSYNQQLSENRAKNVAFFLMDNGITRDRIQTYGYGEDRPIAENTTAEGKRLNRRVTFLISEI